MIHDFNGIKPKFDSSVFIGNSSDVIGDVTIGKDSSIWFQCVLRGDVNYIKIGENVNIQDCSLIHVHHKTNPVIIGNNVSLGHRVTLHGCVLKDNSFVGMCATVLDDVEIGEFSFVAAGSLVTPGKKIPPGVVVMGSPAKIVRELSDKERNIILNTTKNYINYKNQYLKQATQ